MRQLIIYTLKGWAQKLLGKRGAGHYVFQPMMHPTPLYPPTHFNPHWNQYPAVGQQLHPSSRLVYIVAPTQRSGTNFLSYLLSLHNHLTFPSGPNLPDEHFFLTYTNLLCSYCEKTVATWAKWSEGGETALQHNTKQLMGFLGGGIVNYMSQSIEPEQRLLLKAPDARNLANFPHLFPEAKLLLLIRDGRDTVHSFTKSWGGEAVFKKMCQRWAQRVDEINCFREQAEKSGRSGTYLLLRYDHLHTEAEAQMKKIIDFLDLDPKCYDWEGLVNAPVLGSSTFRGSQEGVNWQPVEKNQSFSPTDKWKLWNEQKRRIFKKYAGQQLVELGFASSEW